MDETATKPVAPDDTLNNDDQFQDEMSQEAEKRVTGLVDDMKSIHETYDTHDDAKLHRQASRQPYSFQQFWRGEWKEEHRVPIWDRELRETDILLPKNGSRQV